MYIFIILEDLRLKVFICDDESNELKNIEKAVAEYATVHLELLIEIKSFSNPYDLIEHIHKNGVPDIALLDICMPGVLGTEIAREIMSKSEESTDIIFLTTSSDFAVEAFSLHVSDYLSKPYTKERLTESLDRVIEKREKRIYVPIQCGKEIYRIELQNVLYAEAKNHIVEIHLKSGKCLRTRMPLIKLMELFKQLKGFALVGASYIVNFIYVQSLHHTTLEMTNGEKIPVPRRLRSELERQYFDFYTEEATEK